ncbi:MAG: four helix bundle suffix domain-containing protein [Candidatus Sumerlaeaceae bacterium]
MTTPASRGFIPPHGGYKNLLSYRKAEIIYDIAFHFCHHHLTRGDRTIDKMIQAARSGKQNIVEASQASGTSKETEIKLLNVARASQEELLTDYHDYLRVRSHTIWDKNSKEAAYVRQLGANPEANYETFREIIQARRPEIIANIAICLIHQANYLLNRQIRAAEKDFLDNGGVRERMTRARLQQRNKKSDNG